MEFTRQPDEQLGFVALGWLTMGQLLSLAMLMTGVVLMWRLRVDNESTDTRLSGRIAVLIIAAT